LPNRLLQIGPVESFVCDFGFTVRFETAKPKPLGVPTKGIRLASSNSTFRAGQVRDPSR